MKKFLSLVLALVMALSVATVGFAAAKYECESCHEVFATEALYTAHTSGGCLIDFGTCKYCSGKVATANLTAHEAACPKGAGECEYCGEDYATQADYEAHKKSDCKMINTLGSEDTAKIVDKVIDALKSVDWKGVVEKVVDVVKGIDFEGIIAKIQPIVEKVVGYVQGLFAA